MSDTTQVIVAMIASVPATIGACAAWIAARRAGPKGGLHKKIRVLERQQKANTQLLTAHVRNPHAHAKGVH